MIFVWWDLSCFYKTNFALILPQAKIKANKALARAYDWNLAVLFK